MRDQEVDDAVRDIRARKPRPREESVEGDRPPEDERQSLITRLMEEALDHYMYVIQPDDIKATDYYYGREFGNEQDGRSKVVSTDVRDVTLAQIPSIMRVIYAPDRIVEFEPEGVEDEEEAAQRTDMVRYVIDRDNPGYIIHRNLLKDGLVRRLGIVKIWWEEDTRYTMVDHLEGLTEEQMKLLAADEDVEINITDQRPMDEGVPQGQEPPMLYDVSVAHRRDEGRVRLDTIPREEFVYTPSATCLDEAQVVAHVREVSIDEAVELGISEEEAEEFQGQLYPTQSNNSLKWTRQIDEPSKVEPTSDNDRDKTQKRLLLAEAYALVTVEGEDGAHTERRKFLTLGPQFQIAEGWEDGEQIDELPFHTFTPDPEPNTIMGLSNWDHVGDVQKIKSQIQRHTLDSLSQAVDSVTEVVNGEVNMADLLSPDVNKVVRVNRPGMMREVKHQFVGDATLPVLSYFDDVIDHRTKLNKASQGLDADALQSTTKAAVAAQLSAAQQRLEDIAQVLAETTLRPLYRGIARLLKKHQQVERIIRLRNKYVPVDPRTWKDDMNVRVNVALGQGAPEDRLQAAQALVQEIEGLLQAGVPFVSFVELRAALAEATQLAGHRHPEKFFKPWSAAEQKQYEQQKAQQPPQPDANMALVQVEQQKAQMKQMADEQKNKLEEWKAIMEDDRERERMAQESELTRYELELKYHANITSAQFQADVSRDKAAMDAHAKVASAASPPQAQE